MKLAAAFELHQMPAGSLPVRCHVLTDEKAKSVEDFLVKSLPECYSTLAHLNGRSGRTGMDLPSLLANKLPDPGSVMSGDFGEILTLFFLSSERTEITKLIKKWRYKQDRQKPAPHSDVIIFYQKRSDKPSKEDFVICAEAKQKATPSSDFNPIRSAVEGFVKDSTGRLARTLVWLREKAIDQEQPATIRFLERFTKDLSVEYSKYFKAVAIIDRDLLDPELICQLDLPEQDETFEIVVLGIRNLKILYEAVFARAVREVTIELSAS